MTEIIQKAMILKLQMNKNAIYSDETTLYPPLQPCLLHISTHEKETRIFGILIENFNQFPILTLIVFLAKRSTK